MRIRQLPAKVTLALHYRVVFYNYNGAQWSRTTIIIMLKDIPDFLKENLSDLLSPGCKARLWSGQITHVGHYIPAKHPLAFCEPLLNLDKVYTCSVDIRKLRVVQLLRSTFLHT